MHLTGIEENVSLLKEINSMMLVPGIKSRDKLNPKWYICSYQRCGKLLPFNVFTSSFPKSLYLT
jgi:hypothetical protein